MKIIENINLSFIKYFVDAVDLNGITESAEKNNVSRAAVSQALKRLQDILGYALTTRQKNHFEVTAEGKMFYLKAREILNSVHSILGQKIESKSVLRIGCSASLFESFIAPALKQISSQTRIKFGTSSAIKEFVQDKKVDLGIIIDDGMTESFEKHDIQTGNFILMGKKGSLNKGIIVTEDRPEVISLMKDLPKLKPAVSLGKIKVDSWSGCSSLAHQGLGACLVPDFFMNKKLQHFHAKTVRYPYKVISISRKGEFSVEVNELINILNKLK